MIAQVVPLMSLTEYTDLGYWQQRGLKSLMFAIVVGVIIFAVIKGGIGFVTIGPNEAGIREFCGLKLWRVGPGLHFNIEGLWKVRKCSVAEFEVEVESEVMMGSIPQHSYTIEYIVGCTLKVGDTKADLVAQIYNAKDTDRENMENTTAEKLAKMNLQSTIRKLIENGHGGKKLERLVIKKAQPAMRRYGYIMVNVMIQKYALRPQSELADALRTSGSNSPESVALSVIDDRSFPDLKTV